MSESAQALSLEGVRKGTKIFLCGNYLYVKRYRSKETIFLKCKQNDRYGCKGTASINETTMFYKNGLPHSHVPVSAKDVETRKLKFELKNASGASADNTINTFNKVCRNYDADVAANIAYPSLRSGMLKRRAKNYPSNASTHHEFVQKMVEAHSCNKFYQGCVKIDDDV